MTVGSGCVEIDLTEIVLIDYLNITPDQFVIRESKELRESICMPEEFALRVKKELSNYQQINLSYCDRHSKVLAKAGFYKRARALYGCGAVVNFKHDYKMFKGHIYSGIAMIPKNKVSLAQRIYNSLLATF